MTINLLYYKQNHPFCKIFGGKVKSQLLKEHYLKLLNQYNFFKNLEMQPKNIIFQRKLYNLKIQAHYNCIKKLNFLNCVSAKTDGH